MSDTNMENAAKKLYDSLGTYNDLDNLLKEGQTEGLYLECKDPRSPSVNQDIQVHLAKALSGFSNTNGGVLIWGISTIKRENELDVLNQINPIANCSIFLKTIEKKTPTLTVPMVSKYEVKLVKKKKSDASGVVVAYIPPTTGDPVRSEKDNHFYFRSGDEFLEAPYEVIKKLFTSTKSPDIHVKINEKDVVLKEENLFEIPVSIFNDSSAIGEYITVSLEVLNEADCQKIEVSHFRNVSDMNPGRKLYNLDVHEILHKRVNLRIGVIRANLKGRKKKFCLRVEILAKDMIAREQRIDLILLPKGSRVKTLEERILY